MMKYSETLIMSVCQSVEPAYILLNKGARLFHTLLFVNIREVRGTQIQGDEFTNWRLYFQIGGKFVEATSLNLSASLPTSILAYKYAVETNNEIKV